MRSFKTVFMAVLVIAIAGGAALATDVTFQVNMSWQDELGNFDPEMDEVVVRGTMTDWGDGDPLALSDAGEGIWSGTFDVAEGDHEYKFVIETQGAWEGVDNRLVTVAGDPVILDVVWFNNQEPVELTDVEVLCQVDMSVQMAIGNFDPDAGDIVVVRGGTPPLEWGGDAHTCARETGTDIWSIWIQFDDHGIGVTTEHKFVIISGGQDNWESSPNRPFTPTGEEPDENENGYGEIILDVVFFADQTADMFTLTDVTVTFNCDVYAAQAKIDDPDAWITDVQSGDTVFVIEAVGVAGFFNSWPWGSIPAENALAHDEGTIWTGDIIFPAGSTVDLEYKYGLNDLDVEGAVESNRFVFLDEDAGQVTVNDVFGDQGDLYDDYLSVEELETAVIPSSFTLEQNYPNPFNPSTSFVFNLPQRADVAVTIFNVNGQVVFSENAGNMNPGKYSMTFNAETLASGVYFYRVEAGEMTATKRMVLMK